MIPNVAGDAFLQPIEIEFFFFFAFNLVPKFERQGPGEECGRTSCSDFQNVQSFEKLLTSRAHFVFLRVLNKPLKMDKKRYFML